MTRVIYHAVGMIDELPPPITLGECLALSKPTTKMVKTPTKSPTKSTRSQKSSQGDDEEEEVESTASKISSEGDEFEHEQKPQK